MTSSALLLGIDIGTSSSKAVVADAAGMIVATATVPHTVSNPSPGRYEHDAEGVWWRDLVTLTGRLLADPAVRPADIAAIAVSGIGPCVLPVDEAGTPLRPAILYGIDARAVEEVEWLNARVGAAQYDSQSVTPKLLWLQRHEPEVWARTAAVFGCGGYLTYRLTGRRTLDIYESGSYRPLLGADGVVWDAENGLVDPAVLPELCWSTAVVGEVTAQAAAETGLPAGIPVVAGTVDAAAEATSAGVGRPGELMVMYGSTGFFIFLEAEARAHPGFWQARFLDARAQAVAAGTNTLGTLLNWFRDEFGAPELAAEAAGGASAFQALIELGRRSSPGANGLLALPYFAGERTPIGDPAARGVLAGMSLATTRADVYRALLEGIAFTIRDNLRAFAESGLVPERIRAVGGGAQNALLVQIVSDVAGIEQELPAVTVGAALGDALRAGVGVGVFADLAEATATVRIERTIRPDPELAAFYDARFARFQALYRGTRELVHDLSADPRRP